jgi:hypothetical protein
MSNRCKNACQHRSPLLGAAPVLDHDSQTGFFDSAGRQVIDGQADGGALNDRRRTVVTEPSSPAGQPVMQPVPVAR